MTGTFVAPSWIADVPEGWSGGPDDHCYTFTAGQEGVGALQLTAALAPEELTDDDLRDLAGDDAEGAAKARCGEFVGLHVSAVKAEQSWQQWWLRSGSVMLFVTYICDAADEGAEVIPVGQFLDSLRVRVDR